MALRDDDLLVRASAISLLIDLDVDALAPLLTRLADTDPLAINDTDPLTIGGIIHAIGGLLVMHPQSGNTTVYDETGITIHITTSCGQGFSKEYGHKLSYIYNRTLNDYVKASIMGCLIRAGHRNWYSADFHLIPERGLLDKSILIRCLSGIAYGGITIDPVLVRILRAEKVVQRLLHNTVDDNKGVVHSAIAGLGRIGDKSTIPYLQDLASWLNWSTDLRIKRAAREAIASIKLLPY